MALVAAQLHVGLLVEGVIARGGLAFGPHFMEPDFVFGPALIDAYDLEQGTVAGTKSFRHPSVVLHDMVVEALAGEERGLGRTATPALTLTDSVARYRGEPFLNSLEVHYIASLRSGDFASGMEDERVLAAMIGDYLRNVLTPIRHRIADALDEHASAPNVLAKWVWLADYVDFFLVQREWEALMAPTAWSGEASGIEKNAQTRRTQFSAGGS